ncbi:hypothetical protein [Amorphus sp. MBR-141]
MSGTWRNLSNRFGSGEEYLLGKVVVGSAFYNALAQRDDPLKYAIKVRLPGVTPKDDGFSKIEAAKERVEEIVSAWCIRAGLEESR